MNNASGETKIFIVFFSQLSDAFRLFKTQKLLGVYISLSVC